MQRHAEARLAPNELQGPNEVQDPTALPAAITADPGWLLEDTGFVLAREHEVESVFAVGNGALGVRGSVAEGTSLSEPATFVAGVFDIEPIWNSIPGLMVLADWTDLRVSVDGRPLVLEAGEILEHRRLLDLRQGLLWREWLHRDEVGRVTRLGFLRFASLADRHLAVQCATVAAENYTGRVRLESRVGLTPSRVKRWAATPARPSPSLRLLHAPSPSEPWSLFLQTATTGRTVAFATGTVVTCPRQGLLQATTEAHADAAVESWEWDAQVGERLRVDRFVSVDCHASAAGADLRTVSDLEAAVRCGAAAAVEKHGAAWLARWRTADVQVNGDEEAQRALRFAVYHLISASNPDDPHVSVGARAMTGEAYRGHVFWDTDI